MKHALALAIVLLTETWAWAQPCTQPICCGELPPVRECPLTIVSQPPPPPAQFCAPLACPQIKLFKIEQRQPQFCCIAPPPPIRVFTLPPLVAPVIKLEPRSVNWFRILPTPPRCVDVQPPPPVRVTCCEQPAPKCLPPLCVPNVKLVAQPAPCGALCR